MTWFTEFLLRADASRRGRRASIRRSPGDTVQYNINGQLMNVVIPPNLKAGDTFEVSVPVGDGVLTSPKVDAIDAVPAQASALGPRTSPDREHRWQVRGATPKHR